MNYDEALELIREHTDYGGHVNAQALAAVLAAQPIDAESVNLPVPSVIDQRHENQEYVTYGFKDEATCKAFIKATQYPRTLYALDKDSK